MKSSERKIIIVEAILSLLVVVCTIFTFSHSHLIQDIIYTVSICIAAIAICVNFGFKKTDKQNSKLARKAVLISLIASVIVCFNLGLFLGFSRTFFPMNWQRFIEGFVPTAILIVGMEFLRASACRAVGDNKKLLLWLVVILIIIEIMTAVDYGNFSSLENVFVTFCTIIVPIIASQLLLTFLNVKVGLNAAILYSLTTKLYLYFLPIVPSLGDYIYSVVWVLIPFVTYRLVKRALRNSYSYRESQYPQSGVRNYSFLNTIVVTAPIMALLITVVILVSGIFQYKMIAIASGSMSPTFERGDAVVYNKNADIIEGDVLAFEYDNRIITHRVVKITQEDNKKVYHTKGDANDQIDAQKIYGSSALGKVEFVVKYIGFPTVWFNEILRNI